MSRIWVFFASGAAMLSAASGALAQEAAGAAIGIYEPHADGDRFTVVPDAAVEGDLMLRADISGDAAFGTRTPTDAADDGFAFGFGTGLSLTLFDRALIEAELPGGIGTSTGFSFGDLRGSLRVTAFGDVEDPFALGFGAAVWAPTGSEEDFRSDGEVRADLRAIGSGQVGSVLYTANAGYLARKKANIGDATIGPAIVFGGGVAVAVLDESLELGPELYGQSVLPLSGLDVSISRSVPVELLVAARYHTGPWLLGATIGGGITPSPGTSTLRIGLSVGSELEGLPDRDEDGLLDDVDRCPDRPGPPSSDVRTHGCPDQDGDGIADPVDACISLAGVAHAEPRRHGCPADGDDDRIYDRDDACPTQPGPASSDPLRHGCPLPPPAPPPVEVPPPAPEPPNLDLDGDGFLNDLDACPSEPGKANADPQKNGCPLAALCGPNADEICINEPVLFAFGSAEILGGSADLLRQVAQILIDNPDIELLTVDGHTDGKGRKDYNQVLSEGRAAAVRQWLIDEGGIDESRLSSQGFGMDKPIADNDTEETRARNRRVEFHVLRRSE